MLDQKSIAKILKFGFSGLLVTGLHALVAFALITKALLNPAIANGIAFLVANLFSYIINTIWTFSSPLHGRNLFRFLLVSLLGFLIAVTVSGVAESNGLHYWYGIGLVVCIVPIVTFLLHSFWTYKEDVTE